MFTVWNLTLTLREITFLRMFLMISWPFYQYTSRWKIIQFDGLNVISAAQQGLQYEPSVSPHSHFHSTISPLKLLQGRVSFFFFIFLLWGWRGNYKISSASGIWKYQLGLGTRRGNQQRNMEEMVLLILRITEGRKASSGRKPYYAKAVKNKQKEGK